MKTASVFVKMMETHSKFPQVGYGSDGDQRFPKSLTLIGIGYHPPLSSFVKSLDADVFRI